MTIIHPKHKRSKPKNNARTRELDAEWQKLLARSAAPLVKGAKANGIKIKKPKQVPVLLVKPKVEAIVPPKKDLPVPITQHKPGTKPAVDELAEAKAGLRSRVGVLYNKGGLHYLSDVELADQKKGTHRRRS